MKLTRVGFRAHVKIASRIVSYVLQFTTVADKLGIPSQDSKVWGPGPHVNCAVWRKSVGRCVQLLPVTAVYRPSSEAAARDRRNPVAWSSVHNSKRRRRRARLVFLPSDFISCRRRRRRRQCWRCLQPHWYRSPTFYRRCRPFSSSPVNILRLRRLLQ